MHANARIPTETIKAALAEMNAGETAKATGKKYGIAFQYLCWLKKKNVKRRMDAK